MRIRNYGPRARLAELSPADPTPADLALALAGTPGVVDIVPAARTVLVTYEPKLLGSECAAAEQVTAAIRTAARAPGAQANTLEHALVTIPVTYDGPDLALIADRAGLSIAEVIDLHMGGAYTTAFIGFAPGFAYLSGLDPRLHLSRLESPRPAVPAGAVAIAGEYSAVYPRSSPGGWLLLGRTGATLFDPRSEPPALLAPGTRVLFEPR